VKVKTASFSSHGAPVRIAIVDSHWLQQGAGDQLLAKLQKHFPLEPIMLVSVERDGFAAYAPFQTHTLLALLQLEQLTLHEIDLSVPPAEKDEPLPF